MGAFEAPHGNAKTHFAPLGDDRRNLHVFSS